MIMKNKKTAQDPVTIALLGTKAGAGVTHMGILAAEFLKEKTGARIAVIERNGHGDVGRLEMEIYGFSKTKFTFRGVDYYRENPLEDGQVKESYDYLILDFGMQKKKDKLELEQCKKKIIIGTVSLWEWEEYIQRAKGIREAFHGDEVIYAVSLGDKRIVKKLAKHLQEPVYLLGYQPIGAPLSKEAEIFLHTLM